MRRRRAGDAITRGERAARLRTILAVFLILGTVTIESCASRVSRHTATPSASSLSPASGSLTSVSHSASAPAPADQFATVIRPVLLRRCAPCHEPGGKMYEKLPFDNPQVVSSHSEGIGRRLKGEEKEAFERWIATLPAPTGPPTLK